MRLWRLLLPAGCTAGPRLTPEASGSPPHPHESSERICRYVVLRALWSPMGTTRRCGRSLCSGLVAEELPTDWAGAMKFKPGYDAVWVKMVLTRQPLHLVTSPELFHAHCAL